MAGDRRLLGVLALALALALPAPVAASPLQETIAMDDPHVVYATPEELERTFEQLAQLRVDRVRVSLFWRLVAPGADAKQRPGFDAADPAAYPAGAWERYDRVVRAARRHGLGLLFTITGPPPLWATGVPERRSIEETYLPSPAELEAFAEAAGRRYSGTYAPPAPPATGGGGLGAPPPPPAPDPLPRVDHWSIWNEPNHPGWLTPQWLGRGRRAFAVAPHHYRALVDAAWRGLERSGHAGDVVLLGETAPRGWSKRNVIGAIRPLEFVRELYCLDRAGRPYAGAAATVRGCPPDASARRRFGAEHPALFAATGWAHHPYAFAGAPSQGETGHRDDAGLADLPRLGAALDAAQRRWGVRRPVPIWITEYGYQTNPPDPLGGVSLGRQAAYLNEAEYLAYRMPRVAAFAQFLLYDDLPWTQFPARDPRHWASFQTGLLFADGTPKPSLSAFRAPIHVAPRRVRRGGRIVVFGRLEGLDGRPATGRLELVVPGAARATQVASVTAAQPRGYVVVRMRARRSGALRLVWTDPATGAELASRSARIVVR